MSEPVDDMLGRLRDEPLPFQVDWVAYERELWTRAARAEAIRRRRTVWSFAAMLVAGLVLGVALPFVWKGTESRPTSPVQPAVQVKDAPLEEPRAAPGVPVDPVEVVASSPDERAGQPFTRQFKRADGRLAEIRFDGFTAADDDAPARLVLAAPGTSRKRTERR